MIEVSLPPGKACHLGGESPLLLCGFTVRALAEAACAANYRVYAIDHFGDQDLRELADGLRVAAAWQKSPGPERPQPTEDRKSSNRLEIVKSLGELRRQAHLDCGSLAKLVLAGGTETWPELIDELHVHFETLGPTSAQIRSLRDLAFCRRAAEKSGLYFPRVTLQPPATADEAGPDQPDTWLRKLCYSSGGTQVKRFEAGTATPSPHSGSQQSSRPESGEACTEKSAEHCNPQVYYQSEVKGRVLGATCILFGPEKTSCTGARGRLLGVAESWKQEDWPGPTEFLYRGSWGPIPVSEEQRTSIENLASYVARELGLVGWLQIDLIEDDHGRLWLLEFNPRWAASMEILTLCGCNPLPWHMWANQPAGSDNQPFLPWPNVTSLGMSASKAVLYAGSERWIEPQKLMQLYALARSGVADLPAIPGDASGNPQALHVKAGQPLLTVRYCESWQSSPETSTEQRERQLKFLNARAEQVWETCGHAEPSDARGD
ncbi:MAG: hypothetical protein NXI32_20925 [bacterium]|nr:hypothetical protein [bacterium]